MIDYQHYRKFNTHLGLYIPIKLKEDLTRQLGRMTEEDAVNYSMNQFVISILESYVEAEKDFAIGATYTTEHKRTESKGEEGDYNDE